ncbi:MAG TPA: HEPN domain-containing protein [Anaerolineae bacterium]|nr:HEPN domain-containing protein [Anaerolineae bacterium]
MKPEQMRDLLSYRLEQARDTLHEAVILHDAESYRGALNRAYYAMFYALLGLLATKQLGASKHSGAIALFDREFVKSGLFSTGLSKSLHLAFDRRQVHDYGEMIELSAQIVDQTIIDATTFVSAVEKYLREQDLW